MASWLLDTDSIVAVLRPADVTTDFADSTLVPVAKERGIADIFTWDRREFLTYRFARRRSFRIIPGWAATAPRTTPASSSA